MGHLDNFKTFFHNTFLSWETCQNQTCFANTGLVLTN